MTVIQRLILLLILVAAFTRTAASQSAPALSLRRAVDLYVERNAELEAARYRLERTRADQIAARLRPNPGVTVSGENLGIRGPTAFRRLYEVGVTYTETIELGGKRELRERAAAAGVASAEAQYADTLRRGVARVKRLYHEVLVARYRVETVDENRRAFDELVQFNRARFEEGAIPEGDLIKVRLERIKFDSAVKQAELGFQQAMIRLLEYLGESTFARPDLSGDLDFRQTNPTLESLREIALNERADLRAAALEVEAANQRLELERARARPDINPFVGYKRVAADNTLLAGLSIPLRVRDRNQAGIARAEVDVKTARAQLRNARVRALAAVEAAYAAFQTARDLVRTFRDEMLRQADESSAVALAAYQEGATELLPFLEAQRTRSEVRIQYFQTLFDYETSLVELELATGREIEP